MTAFIIGLHILTCLALIGIVLLQHGKGADIGSAFGGGASQTVFGSRGAGSFLTKLTTGAAVVFMLTSLTLSYFSNPSGVLEELQEEPLPEAVAPTEVEPTEASPDASPLPATEPGDVPSGFEEIPSGFEEIPAPESGAREPSADR